LATTVRAVLPDGMRRAVQALAVPDAPESAVPDVQRQAVKEISIGERRAAEQAPGVEAAEDSRALPEAADSNLVWERILPEQPGAQSRLVLLLPQPPENSPAAWLRAASSPQALAAPPEGRQAARQVWKSRAAERELVLQAQRAEASRALPAVAREPQAWPRLDSVQQEPAAEAPRQPREREELQSPEEVVAEAPLRPASYEPLWLRFLSRHYPKRFVARQPIPHRRVRGNAGAPSPLRRDQSSSNAFFSQ
jgi:hypothetical protein